MVAVTVDQEYCVTFPKDERGDIEPGHMLLLERVVEDCALTYRLAKPDSPFDVLAAHALNEYRAGRTRTLREMAAEEGIDLDAE